MRPKDRSEFSIVIICALPVEADAVIGLFDEFYDRYGDQVRQTSIQWEE